MLSSRPVHWPTDGRMAAKTPGRENALHRGALMTVHGKGKQSSSLAPLQPHSVQPTRTAKDAFPSKNPITTKLVTRPLGDRTPFPNRDAAFATPLPGESKLAKLVLIDSTRPNAPYPAGTTPPSALRPSSARKHIRAPRTSSRFKFETPVTRGNHWDVSELDLLVPPGDESQLLATTLPGAEADEEFEDYDEIEYMPPKLALDEGPPLGFSLPDYKEVGRALVRGAQSFAYDDEVPPVEELPVLGDGWEMPVLKLAVLPSDDPFFAAPSPKPIPAPAPTRRQPVVSCSVSARTSAHASTRTSAQASTRTSATAGPSRPPPSAAPRSRAPAPTASSNKVVPGAVGTASKLNASKAAVPRTTTTTATTRTGPPASARRDASGVAATARRGAASASAARSTPVARPAQGTTTSTFRRVNTAATTVTAGAGAASRARTTTTASRSAATARSTPALGRRALTAGVMDVGIATLLGDVAGAGGIGELEEDFLFDV